MKFNVSTAFIAVLAACASSVFAQSVDWNSADSQACAQKNWAAIKQQVDVTIAENWEFLPSFIKDVVKQSGALNADNTLVSNPTGAQLVVLATSFPSGIFNPYANDISQEESESASESASESQEESESASESASESQEESESESVSEDPTSSAPEATAEPSSTPIKCIPRH
ncbi:hypothetical protein GGH19_002186 [Coemansia sp. RSA 1807]|nr:hypothetical protein GGH19_002186 [Coemansia sp. RSA 1807]